MPKVCFASVSVISGVGTKVVISLLEELGDAIAISHEQIATYWEFIGSLLSAFRTYPCFSKQSKTDGWKLILEKLIAKKIVRPSKGGEDALDLMALQPLR
jgi:hypothetical protein